MKLPFVNVENWSGRKQKQSYLIQKAVAIRVSHNCGCSCWWHYTKPNREWFLATREMNNICKSWAGLGTYFIFAC